ncbi:unnamed protein product [Laminaria digitata]
MWITMLLVEGSPWPAAMTEGELIILGISGVIGLTIGDTAYFGALTRLGARRALLFSTLGPPATALLALPILDEPITARMASGIALTIAGIVWVIRERAPAAAASAPESESLAVDQGAEERHARRLRAGVAMALLGVLCQATGNILTKLGSANTSPLETSVVRLAFGAIGLSLIVSLTRHRFGLKDPFATRGRVLTLFIATFLGTYLGIWLLVTGLQFTSAGVAATLSSMSPVFILPIAVIFLGEEVSRRATLGALIAVAGVALLLL